LVLYGNLREEERLEIGWMLALNILSVPFRPLSGIVFKSIFKTASASKNGI
jgi:hypothetical protein